ncbi:MAG: hypothetical protein M0R80_07790 [Proteobacteria bacterium]|jgi:hypothetical protein|nr:hypothetical protein [Pseudomonadota bacterium]
MNTLDGLTEEFQRQQLAEILSQCTPEQQEFFNIRVFPNGVPADKLSSAYDLCERTIKKNMAGRS